MSKKSIFNSRPMAVAAFALAMGLGLSAAQARDLFVAPTGDDAAAGTQAAPFKTISKAAEVAMPGDVVQIREGIYREEISPARGGTGEDARIIYQAYEGEDVRILGSTVAKGWVKEGPLWRFDIEDAAGDNPFAKEIRHPIRVDADEAGDGWGWLKYGRWTHRGDVFLNGEGLTEAASRTTVAKTPMTWFTKTENGVTGVWANFDGKDPNSENVEINDRTYGLYPEKSGLNYITVRGLTFLNHATHWAPPTVYQPGTVGPNGGHHWVIEDNIIGYSKGLAISLGLPKGEADEAASGHHVVRNNVLLRNGQGGIAGQQWNSHSLIEGNFIEDTNYREQYGGWETAGIKFHGAVGSKLLGNVIVNVKTAHPTLGAAHGIWIDFRNNDLRVSRNVIVGAESNAILSEAHWEGAFLYDNNIVFGGNIATYSSRGEVWVNNLFVDTTGVWTNQEWGDRAPNANARWFGNVFSTGGLIDALDAEDQRIDYNIYTNNALAHADEANSVVLEDEASFVLLRDSKGLSLRVDMPESALAVAAPAVTPALIELPALTNVDSPALFVEGDFFAAKRSNNGSPHGPFATLKAGKQKLTIYDYPARVVHGRKLVGIK